ncbi:MAG: ribosome biogenesis GTPase Der, partial [Chloroflexi bacterium]|nr:ribosome biogenesis GTPase Der [Chloroflexota bacterium]
GKSSLFNRLAGERLAIVEDEPGTTRDRVYADIVWNDKAYTVIDTGGLELAPSSSISENIKVQVEIAIEEADVIIMLVDAKDGLTIPDREVAESLRRSNKPVVLAVNKCDNEERRAQAVDFYSLPLGEPVLVSAYHGLGISELMEKVTAALPESPPAPEELNILKVAILGRPNVGKSMLLNTLLGYERVIVSDVPGTTRDSIDTIVERDGIRALLIDTAGIRRRGSIGRGIEKYSVMRALRAIDRADVALLVLDATEMVTSQDAHVAGYIRDAYKGILVVVNKWDLAEEHGLRKRDIVLEVQKELKFLHYASMVFISAKTGEGVDKILPAVQAIQEARTKRIEYRDLKEAVIRAIESHPPMTKKPFYLRGMKQVEGAVPPTFVFAVNNPAWIHFSYRRYLENSLRDTFGFTGTPLKLIFQKRLEER